MTDEERKAKRAAYMREYNKANRERVRARRKSNREANVERIRAAERASSQRYREANREMWRERQKTWTAEHPDEWRAHARSWAQRNPENLLVNRHVRMARANAAPGRWTAEEWADRCAEYGGVCPRCEKPCAKFTRDHIVPLSRGGSNWIWNLQPLCGRCNTSKSARSEGYYPPPCNSW